MKNIQLSKHFCLFISNPKYSEVEEAQFFLKKIFRIGTEKNYCSANLVIIGKRKSRQLNFQYRQINKSTDVLAFPFYYAYKKEIEFSLQTLHQDLGEIFICYPTAKKQARENHCSLKKEICFLFLHGLLHLLGHNHEEEQEKKVMFALQDQILEKLNI